MQYSPFTRKETITYGFTNLVLNSYKTLFTAPYDCFVYISGFSSNNGLLDGEIINISGEQDFLTAGTFKQAEIGTFTGNFLGITYLSTKFEYVSSGEVVTIATNTNRTLISGSVTLDLYRID